jgi:uncharacterized protein (DUF885 family)
MKRILLPLALLVAAVPVVSGQTNSNYPARYQALRENKSDFAEADRLHRLFDLRWEQVMVENPEFATEVGYPGQNNRWTDQSFDAIQKRKEEPAEVLRVLETIKRAALNPADQLSFDLAKYNLERDMAGKRFPEELMPVNQLAGLQQEIAQFITLAPSTKVRDVEDKIARLNSAPRLIEQNIDLLRRGLAAGLTPPRITLRDVPAQVKSQMIVEREKNPLMESFQNLPAEIPVAEQQRLREAAWEAVSKKVIPAFGKLHDFLVNDYLPKCREPVGISALPDGAAWYAYRAERSTTTSLSPAEIHELGLREVKRIRAEMDKIIRQVGFKGSLAEFSHFLQSDPKFFYTSADELLRGYRDVAKRADPELMKLFGRLPRTQYGVLPVPDYAAQSQTTAYYQPGSAQAGRPGTFFANTYALETRPKWEMEALTLHEAVPGHHLQISLAQELSDLPEFRKHGEYTAFVEGWGLYSEGLGEEMGFYKDPYSKYGQLTYEMWRAVRLVVDTGMHSLGWSRQKAIDFFKENSSKTEHDIVVEIDRYIVWPGQALAYKIGQLKIKELRAYAKQELGEKFDVRTFHDELLGGGALPLDVAEDRIRAWVAQQKSKK